MCSIVVQFQRVLGSLLLLAILSLSSPALCWATGTPEVVAGEYIVKFRPTNTVARGLTQKSAEALLPRSKVQALEFKRQLGRVSLFKNKQSSSLLAASERNPKYVPYDPTDTTCAELMASANVESCEPNYKLQIFGTPNDPRYSTIWGLNSTKGIDAPSAWTKTTGSESVVVAVIDTGVDYTHPDLAANIWTNSAEIPSNGIDDDNNGYIDDVHGANFIFSNDGDPMDDNGHGSHVSGTIGAVGNNALGVVGVNWQVKIMGLKFLDSSGSGNVFAAIDAINYMIAMKARGVNIRVANNSWGGGGYSKSLHEAVQAADAAGIIFTAAAGNESNNNDSNPSYPADLDAKNVVSVAAIDQNQNLASFSNYGANSVDIAAPGVSILSTTPGGQYELLSGTSMATPFVSGALALLASAEPNLSSDELINRMYESAVPFASLNGVVRTGRMLNVGRMVLGETTPVVVPTPDTGSCQYKIDSIQASPDTRADNAQVLMANSDEFNYQSVSLPFIFPLDGKNYSQVTISPNGVLYMGGEPSEMDYDPGQRAPLNSIAALHADLVSSVRAEVRDTSATFYWKSYVFSSASAGHVEVRLTINSDGAVREWISFSSKQIEEIIQSKATVGITGNSVAHAYTIANISNTKAIVDGLAIQYTPSCNSGTQPGTGENLPVSVKTIKLYGQKSGTTKYVEKALSSGSRFRVRVSASTGSVVAKAGELAFYLDGRMCVQTTQISLTPGRFSIAGRLPRGLAGYFKKIAVKIENKSAKGSIDANRSYHKRIASADRFSSFCSFIAAYSKKK